LAQAGSAEQRRRFSRISAHETAVASPSVLIQVKRKVAAIDAMARATQLTHAATLNATSDWGRLFFGCEADRNRGRYSIYRRTRAHHVALLAALTLIVP
jgi:hypothetical protein